MRRIAIAVVLAILLVACTSTKVELPVTVIAHETAPATVEATLEVTRQVEVTQELTRQVEITRLVEITQEPTNTLPAAATQAAATPTPYNSAPEDGSLDTACRITIGLFFSYRQGFSIEAYRGLFTPSSQYLADSVTAPAEAPILLELMPASQHWAQNFPGTPMPGAMLPEKPNEYVYYAAFTYHYEPDTTPVFTIPDHMTIHMFADSPNSCKIMGYGKG